ncbi:MAG TPA: hypothetical protein VGS15_10050 [Candidatus Acidoferrales bacterium]|nr:hypothetical protein [Candidatus Acidoferrales bacterium]
MKRAIRIAWVLAANGSVIAFTLTRYSGELFSVQLESLLELALEILLPLLGIVVELIGWKFARRVNIGYLLACGCFWSGEAIWWRADPFFGVMLIISLFFSHSPA